MILEPRRASKRSLIISKEQALVRLAHCKHVGVGSGWILSALASPTTGPMDPFWFADSLQIRFKLTAASRLSTTNLCCSPPPLARELLRLLATLACYRRGSRTRYHVPPYHTPPLQPAIATHLWITDIASRSCG